MLTVLGHTRILGLYLVGMGTPLRRGQSGPAPTPSQHCRPSAWERPRIVAGASTAGARVTRFPSIAADGRRVYVVGNNLQFFDALRSSEGLLAAYAIGRGDIGLPPGHFLFLGPKAAVDRRSGRLHLFWGEPDSAQTPTPFLFVAGQVTSLWTAQFDPRTGWSAPARIYRSLRHLYWTGGAVGDVASARDGTIHLVVPEFGSFLHVVWDGRTTAVHAIPGTAAVTYASVAVDHRGRLYVGYIGRDPEQPAEFSAVRVITSDDQGGTWSRPSTVTRPSARAATRPFAKQLHTLVSEAGAVHLVWVVSESGRMLNQSVIHTLSRDGGATWSRPATVGVPSFLALQAAVDACGRVHAVFEDLHAGPDRVHLGHLMWTTAGWGSPVDLFPALAALSPGLLALDDGRVALAFLGRPAGAAARAPWSTWYTELTP